MIIEEDICFDSVVNYTAECVILTFSDMEAGNVPIIPNVPTEICFWEHYIHSHSWILNNANSEEATTSL